MRKVSSKRADSGHPPEGPALNLFQGWVGVGLAALFIVLSLYHGPGRILAEDGTFAGPPNTSWRTYLHDYERRNTSPSTLTLPPGGSWRKRISSVFSALRKGAGVEFVTSPAIYKGVLYVGSKNKRFYALDLARGRVLWEFKAEAAIDAPPTVTEDHVLFGSLEGVVYCVERESGEELWRFASRGEITTSPAVADGRVYILSADNRVYALNLATGGKAWTYTNRSPQYVASRLDASPAISENALVVMFNDGNLVSLDLENGRELWKRRILEGDILAPRARRTPAALDGLVYVINDRGYLLALDAENGEERAVYDMVRVIDFVAVGKRIYATDGERLIAISRGSAGVLWTRELAHGEAHSMAYGGGHILIVSNLKKAFLDIPFLEEEGGYIAAYTAERGGEVWGRAVPRTVHSSAAISEDHIAFITTDGVLNVFGTD